MRASREAILMGAANVRNDNPRLLVRSKIRRDERTLRGLPSPIEVTVTERVELDRCADYFTTSETETPRLLRESTGPRCPLAARKRCDRGRR